jgi:hypothetical protein
MRPPVRITTPMPTVEEVGRAMGVSPSEVKEIKAMVDEWVESRRKSAKPTKKTASRSVASKKRKS